MNQKVYFVLEVLIPEHCDYFEHALDNKQNTRKRKYPCDCTSLIEKQTGTCHNGNYGLYICEYFPCEAHIDGAELVNIENLQKPHKNNRRRKYIQCEIYKHPPENEYTYAYNRFYQAQIRHSVYKIDNCRYNSRNAQNSQCYTYNIVLLYYKHESDCY